MTAIFYIPFSYLSLLSAFSFPVYMSILFLLLPISLYIYLSSLLYLLISIYLSISFSLSSVYLSLSFFPFPLLQSYSSIFSPIFYLFPPHFPSLANSLPLPLPRPYLRARAKLL